MNELQKDLQTARQTLKDSDTLYQKYGYRNVQQTIQLLTVAVECHVPWIDLTVSTGQVKFNKCPMDFNFYFDHQWHLVNTTTNAQPEITKWYICFNCGGIGRLNFAGSQYAYEQEPNEVWQDFLIWVKSYDPIDWCDMNNEYVFSLENGLRFYYDFHTGYDKFRQKMKAAIGRYRMQELQAQMDALQENV